MIEFVKYSDEKIRIKHPKQRRQKRPGWFFRGNLVLGKPETRVTISIDLNFDARRIKAMKKIFLSTEIQHRPPGDKVERLGPCEFYEDGLEFLTSFVQPDTGYTFYSWDLLYSLHGSYVMWSIMGGGNFADFENMAREIVNSLMIL